MTPSHKRIIRVNSKYSAIPLILLLSTISHLGWGQTGGSKKIYKELAKKIIVVDGSLAFLELGSKEETSKLSQIMLVRHGEPALNKKGWRKRKEAEKFVRAYDSVGIYEPEYLPVSLRSGEIDTILTSSLNRSISTAKYLAKDQISLKNDTLFREFERKVFSFPNIKLPLKFWTATSRVLWIGGLNKKNIESFSQAKKRAKRGVARLEESAKKNGKTVLVSHGFLNRYLTKYLQKNGWHLAYNGGKGYLSQQLIIRYSN